MTPLEFELPKDLRDIILSKKCVAFLGSGVSGNSYHFWPKLINELCEYCGCSQHVNADSPRDAFLDAAQSAKDLSGEKYREFLGNHFGRPADNASLLYDVILSLPFECYLTVNLDPLLALKSRSARMNCACVKAYPSLDRKTMVYQSIHYLHGLIEEGKIPYEDTIVLSRDEFKTAYSNNSNLMNLLVPTFENDPIVFIGCRLQEPVMPQVFSVCKQHQEKRQRAMMDCGRQVSNPPPKYILLPKPEVTNLNGEIDLKQSQIRLEEEEDYYKEMDIISVWYRATGGDHSLLRLALENLARFPPISPHHGW